MGNQVVVETEDQIFEVVVLKQSNYFRFTIRPKGVASTLSNTRHYAFADEAVIALTNLGHAAGAEMIENAMAKLSTPQMMSDC